MISKLSIQFLWHTFGQNEYLIRLFMNLSQFFSQINEEFNNAFEALNNFDKFNVYNE